MYLYNSPENQPRDNFLHLFYPFLLLFLLLQLDAQTVTSIGIVSDKSYYGERELGWRIKKAAEDLGWTVFLDEYRGRLVKRVDHLDWILYIIPEVEPLRTDCGNYMTVLHPFGFFDEEGYLLPFYEKYDAYLLTIKPEIFKSKSKHLCTLPFYPTLQPIDYKRLKFKELATMLPVWSNRAKSDKFKSLYKSLSQSGFAKFYGVNHNPDLIREGYIREIPFDGVSIIKVYQQHGIVLVLHSALHNRFQIPSARIFEAAAASAVIISDQNAFVKEMFGDTVFYIDTTQSSETIYRQIEEHMAQIQRDPEGAWKMAEQAHRIFATQFLMTDQLLQIDSMHKKLKLQKEQK